MNRQHLFSGFARMNQAQTRPHSPSKPRWTWARVLRRIATVLAASLLTLLVAGSAYQTAATWQQARRFPPPGELVEVGGHALHLQVMGEAHPGPTVILEAGITGYSGFWAWVQPAIAQYARVVAYDRAGLGWSEESGRPRDAADMAQQLHAALQEADLSGPYVLVGHSYGGLLVRQFADLYRDDVAGLVLLDPAHPEMMARLSDATVQEQRRFRQMLSAAHLLARFGLLRVVNLFAENLQGLPPQAYAEARAFAASVKHLYAVRQEVLGWETIDAQVQQTAPLGDLPLVVLSVGSMPPGSPVSADFFAQVHRLHAELAALSTHGRHVVVEEFNHFSLGTNPDHAQRVAALIRQVVVRK